MPRSSHHRRPTLSNDELDPALTDVSRKVIGCAIEIHKALGPGFDASIYENALSNELSAADVSHHVGVRHRPVSPTAVERLVTGSAISSGWVTTNVPFAGRPTVALLRACIGRPSD